jgi:hypothetical protein
MTSLWGDQALKFDRITADFRRHNDLVGDQALLAYFETDQERTIGMYSLQYVYIF